MNLKDILAVSGKGGLYKFISQAKNSIIVESFADGKRMPVHSSAKVSALEDIAIFTDKEEVPLADVFTRIYEKEEGKETISHKSSPEELKSYLESILPDYDRERVYVSDMKKLVQWYNQLIGLGLLKPEEKESEDAEKEGEEKKPAAAKKEKEATPKQPAKKSVAKGAQSKPSTASKSATAATRNTKSK